MKIDELIPNIVFITSIKYTRPPHLLPACLGCLVSFFIYKKLKFINFIPHKTNLILKVVMWAYEFIIFNFNCVNISFNW